MYFYFAIAGFIFGIVAETILGFGFFFSLFLAALALMIAFLYVIVRNNRIFYIAIFILLASVGALRLELAEVQPSPELETRVGEQVTLVGRVIDEPDIRDTHQRLKVLIEEHDSRALVSTDLFTEVTYGDYVRVDGSLEHPEEFITDTGRVFDYRAFLAKDQILYSISFAEVTVLSERSGVPVKRFLFDTKSAFLERVSRVIPEPNGSLLGGLLLGAKQSLGSDLQDKFRETGIIHIVVLSGYNVTIVAESIMRAVSFAPLYTGMSLGAGAIILFAIMTGASATIVRASIMALLVIVARATGRTYAITRALLIAAALMILHNPHILLHDPSFQLSFLATIGLIHLAPLLERYFMWVPEKYLLREIVLATISTQLFVLPLLMYMTGMLSIVSLPVNLLILPFIPLTMLFGFVAGLLAFVSNVLAFPAAFIAYTLLSYELFVVEVFAALPFASIEIPAIGLWPVVMFYAAMILFLVYAADWSKRS